MWGFLPTANNSPAPGLLLVLDPETALPSQASWEHSERDGSHLSVACWALNPQWHPGAQNSCTNPCSSPQRSHKGKKEETEEGRDKGRREREGIQIFKPRWNFTKNSRPCSLTFGLQALLTTHSRKGGKAENHYKSKPHPQPSRNPAIYIQ